MNGCVSFVCAISTIVIIAGFMGYTVAGLPAIPVGIVLFVATFSIGWLFSPERAAGKINKEISESRANKFMNRR